MRPAATDCRVPSDGLAEPEGVRRAPQGASPVASHPGLPASAADTPPARGAGLGAELAPFVAWLATQDLTESVRRSHRAEVEEFLRWVRSDPGPASNRRRRYDRHLADRDPGRVAAARAGLDRLVEYRDLVACTLPIDRR